jgi:hypothetical protein
MKAQKISLIGPLIQSLSLPNIPSVLILLAFSLVVGEPFQSRNRFLF